MKLKVWFNHHAAFAGDILALQRLQANTRPGECTQLEVHSSCTEEQLDANQGGLMADLAGSSMMIVRLVEPSFAKPESYVAWMEWYVRAHEIDIIVVGKEQQVLLSHKSVFEQLGVKLLYPCGSQEISVLACRAEVYRRLRQSFSADLVPYWHLWNPAYRTTFQRSISNAQAKSGHSQVCVRLAKAQPTGFMLHCNTQEDIDQAESILSQDDAQQPIDVMVMEYLPGEERVIDALAWKGQLRSYHTPLGAHNTTAHEERSIRRHLEVLTREFGLSGLFTAVIRKDQHGRLKLLSLSLTHRHVTSTQADMRAEMLMAWITLSAEGLASAKPLDANRLMRTGQGSRKARTRASDQVWASAGVSC